MSTFGNTTEDEDGLPRPRENGIDRGPAEEDRKTLDELRASMRDIASAKKSMGELATMEGLRSELLVMRQQRDMTHEQMDRLIGMYATLRDEFDEFRRQRVIELQSWIAKNGGSTTPEDN